MLLVNQRPRKYTRTLASVSRLVSYQRVWREHKILHILNVRKVRSVMGCELRRQLSEPGSGCCSAASMMSSASLGPYARGTEEVAQLITSRPNVCLE